MSLIRRVLQASVNYFPRPSLADPLFKPRYEEYCRDASASENLVIGLIVSGMAAGVASNLDQEENQVGAGLAGLCIGGLHGLFAGLVPLVTIPLMSYQVWSSRRPLKEYLRVTVNPNKTMTWHT